MTSIWQQLGAFVYNTAELPEENLQAFAEAGGAWAVAVTYNDEPIGTQNSEHLAAFVDRCSHHGIVAGPWLNYFGEDPSLIAAAAQSLTVSSGAGITMLDCEASVQGSTRMSDVALAVVEALPSGMPRGISTNSLNDSVVWNGRRDNVPAIEWQSVRRLGYRLLPQWYNAPRYDGSPWADPVENMQWLHDHGTEDNLHDPSYPNRRAVPLSYVHPTCEATGLEDANVETWIPRVLAAHSYGLTPGVSYYLLDNDAAIPDLALLRQHRGTLYL